MSSLQDGAAIDYSKQDHAFKITKQQAGIYVTCCGDEIQHYSSSEFGLPASDGWYITQADGSFDTNRFFTLAEVKQFLARIHTSKVGA